MNAKPPLSATETSTAGAPARDWAALATAIRHWGRDIGFQEIGIAGVDLADDEARLLSWLAAGRHGEMDYMARHGAARARPAELVPGTVRVISARMDYAPAAARAPAEVLADSRKAYVARYALGRDYHKVLRARLARLAARIAEEVGGLGRVVLHTRELHAGREHTLDAVAEVDVLQLDEASQQQSRAGQQHQGERDLRDNQRAQRPVQSPAADLATAEETGLEIVESLQEAVHRFLVRVGHGGSAVGG